MTTRPAILIHGPTASGKTQLAIAVARKVDGEIINADAMQVYADLDVLTARPTAEEQGDVPHHMFGHVDGAELYSVARWIKEASAAIDTIRARGRTPVIVGGTGLYLHGLTDGLASVPEIPDAVREEVRARVARAPQAAHDELSRADPEAARRISRGDRQRIARALEVFAATGQSLTSFQVAAEPFLQAGEWSGVVLTPPRRPTYARIDARVGVMMQTGGLEEARRLWKRGLPSDLPVMRAHGMPGFVEHFDKRTPLDEAMDRCRRDTRRYAKRQLTWIAHRFTLWPRIPSTDLAVRTRAVLALAGEVDPMAGKG
jgi:tRNA dimethylallyltransferase